MNDLVTKARKTYAGNTFVQKCADEIERLRDERDALLEAAQSVIDRWDTPLWKDVPATAEFIARLRLAVAGVKGGAA